MLIVLPRLEFTSAVECQGRNNKNISNDRFYYSNYNGYILIIEDYYAWISLTRQFAWFSLKTRSRHKHKDKDKDKDRKLVSIPVAKLILIPVVRRVSVAIDIAIVRIVRITKLVAKLVTKLVMSTILTILIPIPKIKIILVKIVRLLVKLLIRLPNA